MARRETWRVREKTPLRSLNLCHTWTSCSRRGYSSADVSLRRMLLKKSMESYCFYTATPVGLQPLHLLACGLYWSRRPGRGLEKSEMS